MRVGIHQPNFLPWRGFFSKIQACDTFVLLDDVQFERGKTFTSRTKIAIAYALTAEPKPTKKRRDPKVLTKPKSSRPRTATRKPH